MEKVKCPECGAMVNKAKFCSECGCFLDINPTPTSASIPTVGIPATSIKQPAKNDHVAFVDDGLPIGVPVSFVNKPQKNDNTTVSDKGLTMLVDCCRKTIATVGGDGYSEVVLYERSPNEFEVHTYSKYEGDAFEKHQAYRATKEVKDKVYAYINDAKLHLIPESDSFLGGGDYIVKYLLDGKIYRISLSMIDPSKSSLLRGVEPFLNACVKQENRI